MLRRSKIILQYKLYKSSYAISDILRFENEKKNEEEKEIRSKYVFRPRLPVLIESDHFNTPFQYEYDRISREYYAWDSELNAVKTVWLVPGRAIQIFFLIYFSKLVMFSFTFRKRLKPPPQQKVEKNVLVIGNLRSLPWAPVNC